MCRRRTIGFSGRAGLCFGPAVAMLSIVLLCAGAAVLPGSAFGQDDGAADRNVDEEVKRLRRRLEGPVAAEEEAIINFSFDEVGIPAFVKLVGEITGRKFVVDEGIEGKLRVVSPKVSRSEVYPLFLSILESAGCSVVREGEIHRVVALPDRPTLMAPVVGSEEPVPAEGIVIKVFFLQHVSVSQVRKLIESKVGGGRIGAVGAIEETNHLVVTDTAGNIRRIERIINEIDQPGLARVVEVVPLQYAGARDLADELNRALSEEATRGERLRSRLPSVAETSRERRRRVVVVASPHSNSLVLMGTPSQILEVKRVVALMDVDTPAGRGRLNAILLKYVSAEDAAKSIKALLARPDRQVKEAAAVMRSSRIAIESMEANNALLVDASPGDFEIVKALIEQIDTMPEQVHIEVLIAEISVSDSFDLGVQMAAVDMPDGPGNTVVQGGSTLSDGADGLLSAIQSGIFPRGLTVGVAHGTRVAGDGSLDVSHPGLISIDAIRKNSRFRIRSNPTLMAQNNHEATISIVNEIPILKSIFQGTGTSRDLIQNVERVDVGIKLKITPHIVPGGKDVRVELNPSIEAVIDPGPSGTLFAPTIARREVSTTVTVPDGETIIIAGLTSEDSTKTVKKVPILGSIPLLGWLFRHTVDATERTNVLIFVTPSIVTSSQAAAAVRQKLESKTSLQADESE